VVVLDSGIGAARSATDGTEVVVYAGGAAAGGMNQTGGSVERFQGPRGAWEKETWFRTKHMVAAGLIFLAALSLVLIFLVGLWWSTGFFSDGPAAVVIGPYLRPQSLQLCGSV